MNIYAVLTLKKEHPVSIEGRYKSNIKLSFADGMIGVIPVFKELKDAEKYARGKYKILTLEVVDEL